MKLRKRIGLIVLALCCITSTIGCGSNTGKTSGKADDLAVLSDEFDNASTLSQWTTATDISNLHKKDKFIDSMDINETVPGSLYMVPVAGTWYGTNTGHLSYKKVTGDFSVTMRVKVLGKTSSIPTGAFDLAGLMARTPSTVEGEVVPAHKENWEYFTTGGEANKRIVDYKTTMNSQSGYQVKEVNSEWIILRMVRVGSTFVKLYKEDEQGEWKFASVGVRTDLPEELQVGINILTNLYGEPDHTITVDYVRFNRPTLSKELQEKVEQKTITDEDWLSAFSN